MSRNKIKYQTVAISLAASTAAGTREATIDLDTRYKKCTGFWVDENTDGDLVKNYMVGVSDNQGEIIPLAPAYLFQAGPEVAPDQKFLQAEFDISGGQGVKVVYKTGDATANDALNFFATFRLEEVQD